MVVWLRLPKMTSSAFAATVVVLAAAIGGSAPAPVAYSRARGGESGPVAAGQAPASGSGGNLDVFVPVSPQGGALRPLCRLLLASNGRSSRSNRASSTGGISSTGRSATDSYTGRVSARDLDTVNALIGATGGTVYRAASWCDHYLTRERVPVEANLPDGALLPTTAPLR